MKVSITVPGEPIARPRQRFGVRGRRAVTYTDSKHPVHAYKAAVRIAWSLACRSPPTTEAVKISIEAVFPRPASKIWKNKPMPSYAKTSKPDLDNVAKAVMDALSGLAYRDDSQVCLLLIFKRVAAGDEQPRTEIEIQCKN